MKIALLGTRGIPNNHGGFEQFAEYLSRFLAQNGHEVYVYNSHTHPFQEKLWNGVHIVHKFDPEGKIGTVGQFIYDFNCILDSRKREFDIVLQLGYTSSSIWGWLLPKKSVIVTNMDGLEWKRSKYNKYVRKFLKYAEKIAISSSDYLVSDSLGIQSYLKKEYHANSEYIAYGAEFFSQAEELCLVQYNVAPYQYDLLVARLEPENNIEVILDGIVKANTSREFLVVGKHETKFGSYLKTKFKEYDKIRFLGGIYDIEHLNNLRYYSNLYFHGHSVGGTNPSLLEAMASNSLIVANDNIFNKSILGEDAFYFESVADVVERSSIKKQDNLEIILANNIKIKGEFSWKTINEKYENYLLKTLK